uniref:Tc1-like transposase DDE domain-containing protein n=1 Tax=Oreochromis aureus TaxID=47969 RepID=A0AAZ1X517_OREAU
MERPLYSHDLNLIEQLWDQLGRAVHARLTNMTTLADLHQMLVEEWDAFPHQCVTKLGYRLVACPRPT